MNSGEWISLREGAKRLGISPMSFYKVARSNPIRVRRIPGLEQARYNASDIDELARASVATSPLSGRAR